MKKYTYGTKYLMDLMDEELKSKGYKTKCYRSPLGSWVVEVIDKTETNQEQLVCSSCANKCDINFSIGDKVIWNGAKWKIDHIRNNGTAKIHSISGKTNEKCYMAPVSEFVLVEEK